jgi:CBS domain-containing protein
MTRDPAVVRQDDSLSAALSRLCTGGYRHLPVVDDSNAPVGLISVRDLVHYMVEHFPETVYNLPPVPDQPQAEADGA